MMLKQRFRILPSWSDLRSLGGSRIIRTSYFWLVFVPLAANLLSKLGSTVYIRFLEFEWTFPLTLPFSWRFFYFGSVLISIATGIYWLRCPRVIRDFADYPEFEKSGRGPLQEGWLLLDALRGYPSPRVHLEHAISQFNARGDLPLEDSDFHAGFPALLEKFPLDINPGQCFWFIHKLAERRRKWSRMFATLFYGAGLALILVVLYENFLFVWRLAS